MLKKFLLGLIVAGSIFGLFAVYQSDKQNEGKTVIQYASWGSKSEVDILKPLLVDFEMENPDLKVEFMHIPQNYFQKIHLLFASNTAPDVIFINNLYLPLYANAGVLENLDDYDINQKDFYKKSLDALSWKGKLYAVPRDVSNLVIYYNKEIFKSANLSYPKENWTMDEFLHIAKILTKRPNVFGISFEEDSLFYLPYLMSEGGGILSDDLSREIIEDSSSQSGLKFYANLRKKYHVAPTKSESASATMAQMFLQGKLAMHLSGRWLVPKYREEAVFEWDIVPFPKGASGSIVPLDASGWAISKNSKHKQDAFRLIKFLSSKTSIEKLAESGLIVPARKDCAFVIENDKKPKNSHVFIDVIHTSKPTPVSVDYNVLNDKLKEKNERLFN
ncbi:MAG: sugar ABC transporter substrate-binding protein [Brachyspira sp.]|nr:sugar ABC transporter substrate-binding protein [Brachyspira sp.]